MEEQKITDGAGANGEIAVKPYGKKIKETLNASHKLTKHRFLIKVSTP